MTKFESLPDDCIDNYQKVFTDTYWWQAPNATLTEPATDALPTYARAGEPSSVTLSSAGDEALSSLWDKNSLTLHKLAEIAAGGFFNATTLTRGTFVFSVIEGLHRQPQKPTRQTSHSYAHTNAGFLVRRRDTSGTATYFKGHAWHIILPTSRDKAVSIAEPLLIERQAENDMIIPTEDIAMHTRNFREPSVDDFGGHRYFAWNVGRTHTHRPHTSRQSRANETWYQRTRITELYSTKSYQHKPDNQSDDQKDKRRQKVLQLGFNT